MPRPKRRYSYKRREVQIPQDLDTKLQLLLMDPATGKERYGSFTNLTINLLSNWVKEQTSGSSTNN